MKRLGKKVMDALRKTDPEQEGKEERPEGARKLTFRQMLGFPYYRRWYDQATKGPKEPDAGENDKTD